MTQPVDLEQCDLLVFGESVPGVAAALRGARSGLDTILVTAREELGGLFASLGALETHYNGVRSPILEEIRQGILDHYRSTYGESSPQFRCCADLEPENPMLTFEPHVAQSIIASMVAAENHLRLLHRRHPAAIERNRRLITAVRFRSLVDDSETLVRSTTFIDGSYVGDLAAAAGVPYRVGRESRSEFGEPHAGRLFTRWIPGRFPIEAADGRLNIHAKSTTMGILAGSTGEGDDEIQDYSFRLCLSSDPGNRRLPEKPERYRREDFLAVALPPEETEKGRYPFHHRFLTKTLESMVAEDHIFHGHALPNDKRSWNATNFTGAGKAYPDADLTTRGEIERHHLDHALGILYFLQNDTAVPEGIRAQARTWGLACDEFLDNDNVPSHLYVREARRIRGRTTFSEHDALLAPRSERAPVHRDSVAITDFPLDSLACTPERRPGTTCDGQFFLQEQTRPAQVPYEVMLSVDLDNLLVPVCCSVTHVAWGTIRQTPTLIQLGEAAGSAAALAHEEGTTVANIDIDRLQRRLVENGHMISFFNDFDMATQAPWVAAVQYLATKGFFDSYDAGAEDRLDAARVEHWRLLAQALGLNAGMLRHVADGSSVGDAALEIYHALGPVPG